MKEKCWNPSLARPGTRPAALKFIKAAMKHHGRPRAVVTDALRSYAAAMNEIGNADKQEVGRWLNNRAENSHQPFRRRERAMLRFRRMKTLQKFSSVHAAFHNHFNQDRQLLGDQQAHVLIAIAVTF
jgi:putative transposase